jgi:cytochrome c-type biogenesis protein CcmF
MMSDASFDSMLSREGTFLLGNALLVGAAFAVLWGTVYPSVSEAIFGTKTTVEQSYFNSVMAPIGLMLLALAGIGPLLSWRRTSVINLLRAIRIPLIISAMAAPVLWVLARQHTGASAAFILCVFLICGVIQQLLRFMRSGVSTRRQFGGYIVHVGLAIMFIGFTGSSVFKIELEPIELKNGQTMRIGEYTLRFEGLGANKDLAPEKISDVAAMMSVLRGNEPARTMAGEPIVLRPNIDVYKAPGASDPDAAEQQPSQQARRPAIMTNPGHDLYLALIGYDATKNTATIKAYLNPLVMWIWISQAFFIGGSLIAMWPEKKRRRVVERAVAEAGSTPASRSTRGAASNPVVAATAQSSAEG